MEPYRIDIMTLFPGSMSAVLGESIIGRAAKKGAVEINCHQIRDYTENKQMQVDDYPYGGGWGLVMMAQPLKSCLDDIMSKAGKRRSRVIYMSPQGKPFDQEEAKRLRRDYDHLVLVCGHYEGVDERFIEECVDEEISLGDFVLTGGEIAAMAVADCVCRMVPGVLADEECYTGESHWDGLLEYPQYTRPEVWEGRAVPEVLLTGDHAKVAKWRRKKQLERTLDKRPDMFEKLELGDKMDRKLVEEIKYERLPEGEKLRFEPRRAEPDDVPGVMQIVAQAQRYLRESGVDQWQDGYPREEVLYGDIELRPGLGVRARGRARGLRLHLHAARAELRRHRRRMAHRGRQLRRRPPGDDRGQVPRHEARAGHVLPGLRPGGGPGQGLREGRYAQGQQGHEPPGKREAGLYLLRRGGRQSHGPGPRRKAQRLREAYLSC